MDGGKPGDGALMMVLPCPKRVRAVFSGKIVADSRAVLILRGQGVLPVYYFPRADVKPTHLRSTGLGDGFGRAGPVERFDLVDEQREIRDAAWSHPQPADPALAPLRGHIGFVWGGIDAWFEEDEEVFVHPRDPHVRIDTLQSSAHLQVVLAGVTLADSRRPLVLVETNHPVRYYLPPDDVRLDLLSFSPKTTRCPYKGVASYWSASIDGTLYENVAWTYRNPIAEIPRIKDLIAFYPEAVDAILRDGTKLV